MDDVSSVVLLYRLPNGEFMSLKEVFARIRKCIKQFFASMDAAAASVRRSRASIEEALKKIRDTPSYQFLLNLQRMKEKQCRRAEIERIRVLLRWLASCCLARKNLSIGNRTYSTPKEIRMKPE